MCVEWELVPKAFGMDFGTLAYLSIELAMCADIDEFYYFVAIVAEFSEDDSIVSSDIEWAKSCEFSLESMIMELWI